MPVPSYIPRRRSSLSTETSETPSILRHHIPKCCYHCERAHLKNIHHHHHHHHQQEKASMLKKHRSAHSKSLLGNMRESLLHDMTSGMKSSPLPFVLAISTRNTKRHWINFDAYFYTWPEGNSSAFVGSIDLGEHTDDNENNDNDDDRSSSDNGDYGGYQREFPGLKVPARGKLQFLLCNNESSMIRCIVLPYNIRKLKSGYKVFIRQVNVTYTIHVNFINVNDEFYIFGDLKIIFQNHVLNDEFASEEQKLVGTPTKVDLKYYLEKCHLCDESAIEENDEEDDDEEEASFDSDLDGLKHNFSKLAMKEVFTVDSIFQTFDDDKCNDENKKINDNENRPYGLATTQLR